MQELPITALYGIILEFPGNLEMEKWEVEGYFVTVGNNNNNDNDNDNDNNNNNNNNNS